MARPVIFDADVLAIKLLDYIDKTDQPFIQEFCLNEDVSRDTVYRLAKDNKALSDSIQKALDKQELYILQNASIGKVNPVFGIFRLKQPAFGYTDKADLTLTAKQELPDPGQLKGELKSILQDMTEAEKHLLLGE